MGFGALGLGVSEQKDGNRSEMPYSSPRNAAGGGGGVAAVEVAAAAAARIMPVML